MERKTKALCYILHIWHIDMLYTDTLTYWHFTYWHFVILTLWHTDTLTYWHFAYWHFVIPTLWHTDILHTDTFTYWHFDILTLWHTDNLTYWHIRNNRKFFKQVFLRWINKNWCKKTSYRRVLVNSFEMLAKIEKSLIKHKHNIFVAYMGSNTVFSTAAYIKRRCNFWKNCKKEI